MINFDIKLDASLDSISSNSVLKNTLDFITERQENKGVVKHSTGFLEIDACLQGLIDGELTVIAALSGHGKSTLLMNMMINNLFSNAKSRPILILTGLVDATQYMLTIIAALQGVRLDNMKKGEIDEDEWPKLSMAFQKIKDSPLYIFDGIRTVNRLESLIDQIKEKHAETPIVAIDDIACLHLREVNFFAWRSREIVSRLKEIAQNRNIPILFAANISNKVGNREFLRPQLQDIDCIQYYEYLVDKILLIYRDGAYNKTSELQVLAEILIAKNSMGKEAKILLRFYPEFARFENYFYID